MIKFFHDNPNGGLSVIARKDAYEIVQNNIIWMDTKYKEIVDWLDTKFLTNNHP